MHTSGICLNIPGGEKLTITWRNPSTLKVFTWGGFSYGVPTSAIQLFSPTSIWRSTLESTWLSCCTETYVFSPPNWASLALSTLFYTHGFWAPLHPMEWDYFYSWDSMLSAHERINKKQRRLQGRSEPYKTWKQVQRLKVSDDVQKRVWEQHLYLLCSGMNAHSGFLANSKLINLNKECASRVHRSQTGGFSLLSLYTQSTFLLLFIGWHKHTDSFPLNANQQWSID